MENILKEQLKDEIILLFREAYFAKAQYFLLYKIYEENLLNNKNNPKYLFATTFDALEFSVLLKLTKIYDTDPRRQSITLIKILSKVQSNKELNNDNGVIKKYVDDILTELNNKKIEINKIKTCRDKVVSHMDKNYRLGLLSLKCNEQITFDLLKEYSDYAYNILKKLYELVYNEVLLDSKQFEILELEYETIHNKLKVKD